MCFNTPKYWALGWYIDSVKVIDISSSGEAENVVLVSRQSKLSNYADSYLVTTITDSKGVYYKKDLRKDRIKVALVALDLSMIIEVSNLAM